jgi:hypothetical protein
LLEGSIQYEWFTIADKGTQMDDKRATLRYGKHNRSYDKKEINKYEKQINCGWIIYIGNINQTEYSFINDLFMLYSILQILSICVKR